MIGVQASNRVKSFTRINRLCGIAISLSIVLGFYGYSYAQSVVVPLHPSFWFRILVPNNLVPAKIGHASFRLGHDMVLVFAADLPVEQAALQQITGISNAVVVHLQHATILRIPLRSAQSLHAIAAAQSFHIMLGLPHHIKPVDPAFVHGRVIFSATSPGPVVALTGAGQGAPLLVGTVTSDSALSRNLQGPGYSTISASSGIVVVAASDELDLAPKIAGFVLRAVAPAQQLPIGDPPISAHLVAAPAHDGGLDLPNESLVALRHRMELAQQRVAKAPPLDRLGVSLRLARTLLALDLGPEAHGVLTDVLRSDPAAINDPQRRALLGVSDVLSYRPNEVAIDWPKSPPESKQDGLWRGLADAELHRIRRGTDLLSVGLSSLIATPPLLRAQMSALVAQTLIAGGKLAAAQTLLDAFPHDHGLALAHAELLQAAGHPRAALVAYRKLLNDPDQRMAGISQFRSIMLRTQLHELDARSAAAALGRDIYEWRSTRHELTVRLAIARLRAQAGDWPRALTGLIKTARLFPKRKQQILSARKALFAKMFSSGAVAHLSPFASAAAIQNNADLIPPGPAGVPTLKLLSKNLLALGLPGSAATVIGQMIARLSSGETQARLGLELARINLDSGHLKRAQTALSTTSTSGIDPDLAQARTLLADEIAAKSGDVPELTVLTKTVNRHELGIATDAAAAHHNWLAAEQTAKKIVAISVPANGRLGKKAKRSVLRWAVAAFHVKDTKTLAHLRVRYLERMGKGREAGFFDTMTAPPVTEKTGLSAALRQIAAIERTGRVIGSTPRPDASRH